MEALLRLTRSRGTRIIVPAGVLAQVWGGSPRQAPLHLLLKRPTTEVPPLDRVLAEATGRLCKLTGTTDVVDASVVITARAENALILTSDPLDIRRLDEDVLIEIV